MGTGASVSPAAVAPAGAGKPEKAEKFDKSDSSKAAPSTSGASKQRNSTALRANEALIFNFIRKKVTRRTPDVPLMDILKESRACNNFMRYIRESLVTDLVTHGMDSKTAESAKDTAYNYLQFWLDTSDFTLFSASSFRNFRAEKICERYLAHGSRNLLPFSRLMVDEILLRRDAESTVPEDLFTPAQGEAYEFLEAEVLPCYLTCEGPSGYRMVKKLTSVIDRLRRSTTSTRSTCGSAKMRQTSTEVLNEMQSKLAVVLWDPMATRAFKDFLSTVNGAELLIFFLEVTDFKEMFTAVLAQAVPPRKDGTATGERDLVSRDFHYFLTRSHKIYDKYLKLGSPLRELFTEKEMEDLVRRVSSLSDLNPSLFDDLKDKVLEHMLVEHFSEFQKSEQNANYQRLVQVRNEKRKKSIEYIRNRRKMLDVAKSVSLGGFLSPKPKLEAKSNSSDPLGESQKEATAAGSGSSGSPNSHSPGVVGPGCRPSAPKDRISTPNNHNTGSNVNNGGSRDNDECDFQTLLAEEAQELLDMLNSNVSSRFQQYLSEQQEAHKLLFWFEIEDYKAIPHTQTVFVQGRAQKVFDKYVKRGAPLELMLDMQVRNAIVASIDKAHLHLFDAAQQTIFESLLQEEWPLFKQHDLFVDYQREKEDRKRSSAQHAAGREAAPVVDVNFSEILNFPILCSSFKKFVETEFCVEPLMFWLEVEEYKRLPRSQYMQNRCRKIVNRYIRVGAPMAISITAEARAQAYERIKDPGPLCFQMAELEVYNFMENCLLPKFRKSAEYQELLRSIENERKAAPPPVVKPELEMDTPMSPGSAAGNGDGPLTLKTLLASQAGVKFFKEFCESRHCEENLLFWLEAEDFKDIPGKDFLKIRARKIVNKYINEDSKQQVNIPSTIRLDLLRNLEQPGRSLFQKAQTEIFKLMQKDSYPPFLQSEQYKAYQDLLQGSQETTSWSAVLRRRSLMASAKDTHRASSYEKSQT